MPMMRQNEVRAFAGENRLLLDSDLPDNVSPDALNCDYSRATIRKRDGFLKLHGEPALEGGVRFDNSAQNKTIYIRHHTDYATAFAGDFTIEFWCRVVSFSGSFRIFYKINGSSFNNGIAINGSSNTFGFTLTDSGGVNRSPAAFTYTLNKWHHVVLRRTGTTLQAVVDGTATDAGVSCSGWTSNTAPILFNTVNAASFPPTAVTAAVIVDELRIWKDYRTDDELSQYRYRELTDDQIDDGNLVGYWRMNDNQWNIVRDRSKNKNHGAFYSAGPSFERGLVPEQSGEGFAVRFDGLDDTGTAPYHSAYAPVLNTSNTWTLECWARLDTLNYDISVGRPCFIQFGSWTTGNGAVVGLHLDSGGDGSLYVSYSTTTTKNNAIADTGYDFVPGVPVHIAVTRNAGTVKVFINGELMYTDTGATTENGPTSSTSYGMFFGGRNSAGSFTAGLYAPVTLDEVRLWNTDRGQGNVQLWMNRTFPDVKNSGLIGYWRFDQSDKEFDETNRSAITFSADGNKPRWSYGRAYPVAPKPMLLLAPVSRVATANETLAGGTTFDRELVVATQSSIWTISGGTMNALRQLDTYGESVLWDWVQFRDWLIFGNGIDTNFKYQGKELPQALTIAQPSACSAAAGAAGTLTGSYSYRVSFRNSFDGTESLASAAVTVSLSSQKGSLSSIPVSTDAQVNSRRIYRLDPNATVYRYLADIADNSTTTYTDDTASITSNSAINDYRGHLPGCKYWEVFAGRIWAANSGAFPAGLYFSEANTLDFPAANVIYVDRGDGDEITGLRAAFGGLVIFKRKSIHFLSGDGATSFQVRIMVPGHGCVSAQTIGESPRGLYYLGQDGVYLFTGSGEPQFVSITQQNIFKMLAPDTRNFSAGAYIPHKHLYLVSFDTASAEALDFYDAQSTLFTAYWRLNTDGAIAGGGLTLSSTGTVAFPKDSVYGGVLSLGGAGNLQGGSGSASIPWSTTANSMGCWIYITSTPGSEMGVFSFGDGSTDFASLSITTTRQLHGHHQDLGDVYSGKYSIPLNQWVHVAACWSNSVYNLYVNGYEYGRKAGTTINSVSGTSHWRIGDTISHAQFSGRIHNAWWVDNSALTRRQINDIYEYEVWSVYGNRDRITMVYDENTQTWAKWDAGWDYFCIAEHSQNRIETLATRRGFVYRLFDGTGDGFGDQYGSNLTKSGTLTAVSGSSITDATASFPTENYGLAGTDVLCVNTSDGSTQRRLILNNTATALYLDQPILPAVTGTYYVAPIEWYWESRWMDVGDPYVMKRFYRFAMWLAEAADATTVTFKYKTDYSETWVSTTFTNADEWTKFVMNHRGRKLKIRFENYSGDAPIEIAAFTSFFSPRDQV